MVYTGRDSFVTLRITCRECEMSISKTFALSVSCLLLASVCLSDCRAEEKKPDEKKADTKKKPEPKKDTRSPEQKAKEEAGKPYNKMDYGPYLSASIISDPAGKFTNETGAWTCDMTPRGFAIRLTDD